jgi:hypothetical protein
MFTKRAFMIQNNALFRALLGFSWAAGPPSSPTGDYNYTKLDRNVQWNSNYFHKNIHHEGTKRN